MAPGDLMMRARGRAVWTDAARSIATLESFARTEADGGRDIATAARRVDDAELRRHLERHARDELKHAELFRRRAREMRAAATEGGGDAVADQAYDLSRGRPSSEVDAHGFFKVGLLDEMGEVPYVAMLHVAEQRAARLFKVHRDLTRGDATTCAIFEEILRDESYHVAWTAAMLERWRTEGRGDEVRKALKSARTSRFMGAWKRAGARAGVGFGRVVLYVLYFTVVAPFGLIARGRAGASPAGWRTGADADARSSRESRAAAAAAAATPLDRLRSQA